MVAPQDRHLEVPATLPAGFAQGSGRPYSSARAVAIRPCYASRVLLLDDDDELPDQPEEAESKLVAELGDDGLRAIDEALLRYTRGTWHKVARVVADAMEAGGFATSEDAPIDLHVRRMVGLVDSGVIEAQGDVCRPRWSEVRQPASSPRAEPPPTPPSDLMRAVRASDAALATSLLRAGANVAESDRHGWLPLHNAETAELVELLVSHGAPLEARGTDQWTALHLACVSGCVEATAALIEVGADVNSVARGGNTPLHLAVVPGIAEAVELLLRAGANPKAVDKNGLTPAAAARAAGHIELAELIEMASHGT